MDWDSLTQLLRSAGASSYGTVSAVVVLVVLAVILLRWLPIALAEALENWRRLGAALKPSARARLLIYERRSGQDRRTHQLPVIMERRSGQDRRRVVST